MLQFSLKNLIKKNLPFYFSVNQIEKTTNQEVWYRH